MHVQNDATLYVYVCIDTVMCHQMLFAHFEGCFNFLTAKQTQN